MYCRGIVREDGKECSRLTAEAAENPPRNEKSAPTLSSASVAAACGGVYSVGGSWQGRSSNVAISIRWSLCGRACRVRVRQVGRVSQSRLEAEFGAALGKQVLGKTTEKAN
eukprot:COSAG04_NODE_1193_length_7792_cov_7.972442_7_plen_111_part_00